MNVKHTSRCEQLFEPVPSYRIKKVRVSSASLVCFDNETITSGQPGSSFWILFLIEEKVSR